jgi:hypothetical protein
MRQLKKVVDCFTQVEFFDFPVCVLGEDLIKNQRVTVFDAQGRMDEFKQVGYNPQRFRSNKGDFCEDVHKTRLGVCDGCAARKRCAGIWKPYPRIFGMEAVQKGVKSCAVGFLNSKK